MNQKLCVSDGNSGSKVCGEWADVSSLHSTCCQRVGEQNPRWSHFTVLQESSVPAVVPSPGSLHTAGLLFFIFIFSRVFPKAPEGDPPCSKLYSLHLLGQKPCSMHRRRADAQPSTDAHHQVGAVLGCTPRPLLLQHPGVAPPAPKVSCRQKKGGKNVGSRGQECICGAVVAAAYRSVGAGSGRAGRDEFSSTLIYLLLSEPAQRAGRNSKPEKFLVFFSKHLPEKDAKLNATSKNIRTKQIF